jgi:hypothetical protein
MYATVMMRFHFKKKCMCYEIVSPQFMVSEQFALRIIVKDRLSRLSKSKVYDKC